MTYVFVCSREVKKFNQSKVITSHQCAAGMGEVSAVHVSFIRVGRPDANNLVTQYTVNITCVLYPGWIFTRTRIIDGEYTQVGMIVMLKTHVWESMGEYELAFTWVYASIHRYIHVYVCVYDSISGDMCEHMWVYILIPMTVYVSIWVYILITMKVYYTIIVIIIYNHIYVSMGVHVNYLW